MSKLNPEVLAKTQQIKDLMLDVMNALRPSRNPQPAENDADELRYLLTLISATEAVDKVRAMYSLSRISDEELTSDVKKVGETLTTALRNARFNLMLHMMDRAASSAIGDMMKDLLDTSAPPQRVTEHC